MRKLSFRKDILPHVVALAIFLVVTILFFSPVFFENRSLEQPDINQWQGGAEEIIKAREATGEEPLWTNSMFGGMPAYLIDVKWSDQLLTYTKIVFSFGLPHPVRNIFLAFLSFYILLLAFGVRPYLAIGGALAFGLSSYMIIGVMAGHNARIGAIALMPLVMAGIHITFQRNLLLGAGITALGTALHLRENHLQITYYLLFIIAIYGIIQLYSFFKEKELKSFLYRTLLLMLVAVLALGTFYGKFWAISEFSKYSMRGTSELKADSESGENQSGLKKDYAFFYSYGKLEPMTLFIPDFLGGSSSYNFVSDENSEILAALQQSNDPQMANQLVRFASGYWGSQPYSSPYYAGAVLCFLFILGIFFAERKYVIWLVTVAILGAMLAMGSNLEWFNYAMFDYFPGYNKFRSVTFAILLTLFAIPLLGMIGLENYLRAEKTKGNRKKFLIALGIPAGFCLLVFMFAGMASFTRQQEFQLPQWFLNALQDDRKALMRSDAIRSFLFVILAGAAISDFWKSRYKTQISVAVVVVLIVADIWTVDRRYFGEDNYRRKSVNSFFTQTAADKEILKDTTPGYRVYNLIDPFNEARTSFYHQSVGGYHGAKIRRYQDLIEYCLQPETESLISAFQTGSTSLEEYGVINMLNIKYLVYGEGKENILRNQNALGNAWFVQQVNEVSTADEEIARTCNIDTRTTAVINTSQFPVDTNISAGTVETVSYEPSDITYESHSEGDGIIVSSEIYYP